MLRRVLPTTSHVARRLLSTQAPRFDTETKCFDERYAKRSSLQQAFNKTTIAEVASYVARHIRGSDPLTVYDLGCGDGAATFSLLKALDAEGVSVARMIGVDVSPQLLVLAKEHSANDSRLEFTEGNIEQMSLPKGEADAVVSLFALQWMNDINQMAKRASELLKPEGVMAFFVPLEKNDLFAVRQNVMNSEKWRARFEGSNINPFIEKGHTYYTAFLPYCSVSISAQAQREMSFTAEGFRDFLSGWMQEVRYLNSKNPEWADEFLNDLMVELTERNIANVRHTVEGVRFNERFFSFQGTTKPAISAEIGEKSPRLT